MQYWALHYIVNLYEAVFNDLSYPMIAKCFLVTFITLERVPSISLVIATVAYESYSLIPIEATSSGSFSAF